MGPSTRRDILRLGAAAFSVAVAGCTSASEPAPTDTETNPSASETPAEYGVTTPAPGECEEQHSPTPTVTKELEPRAYPDYPSELTANSTRRFVAAYERAYWYNMVLARYAGTDEVRFERYGALDGAVIDHNDGYIVGVAGELKTADTQPPPEQTPNSETPTPVPYVDLPFSAWYYLTPEFALRKERTGDFQGNDNPEPDLTGAVIIVCDS